MPVNTIERLGKCPPPSISRGICILKPAFAENAVIIIVVANIALISFLI